MFDSRGVMLLAIGCYVRFLDTTLSSVGPGRISQKVTVELYNQTKLKLCFICIEKLVLFGN